MDSGFRIFWLRVGSKDVVKPQNSFETPQSQTQDGRSKDVLLSRRTSSSLLHSSLELSATQVYELNCEPASEPLHFLLICAWIDICGMDRTDGAKTCSCRGSRCSRAAGTLLGTYISTFEWLGAPKKAFSLGFRDFLQQRPLLWCHGEAPSLVPWGL